MKSRQQLCFSQTVRQLRAAVNTAKSDAIGKCLEEPECCATVSVVVERGNESTEIEAYASNEGGGEENLCGKTFTYDCKSKKWSE